MPTIFSHAIFASAIGAAFRPERNAKFWVLTAVCSMLPDADVISFAFGVGYGSMLGHRGITHSILFALFLGTIVSLLFLSGTQMPRWNLALYFAVVTFSHPLLDMLTNGGLGVALFAPFSGERFFFPWRPIRVSPIGIGFFSERGLAVLMSEFVWIWIPSMLIAGVSWIVWRQLGKQKQSSAEAHPVR